MTPQHWCLHVRQLSIQGQRVQSDLFVIAKKVNQNSEELGFPQLLGFVFVMLIHTIR